ncbi:MULTISPECIES: hypothetical protein [unclassified Bartonella]|uniref:hypothetical protein n=1 Tax=unclassified Bartonella TaxID=2645622 RepID=UPI0035CF03EA
MRENKNNIVENNNQNVSFNDNDNVSLNDKTCLKAIPSEMKFFEPTSLSSSHISKYIISKTSKIKEHRYSLSHIAPFYLLNKKKYAKPS